MVAILSLASSIVIAAIAVNAQAPPTGQPGACKTSACEDVNAKLNAVTNGQACSADMSCYCSNDILKGLAACYNCGDKSASGVTQADIDQALKFYADTCQKAGHPIDVSSVTSKSGGSGGSSATTGGNTGSTGGKTGGATSLHISTFAAAVALGGLVLL